MYYIYLETEEIREEHVRVLYARQDCGNDDNALSIYARSLVKGIIFQEINLADIMDFTLVYKYDCVIIAEDNHVRAKKMVTAIRKASKCDVIVVLVQESEALRNAELLTVGADDVLSKQTDVQEIFARLRAHCRRVCGHPSGTITTGKLVLEEDFSKITFDGKEVVLPPKRHHMLAYLIRCGQKRAIVVQEFMDYLWADANPPGERIIDVYAYHIRQALRQAGSDTEMVISVGKSRGLQLTSTIEQRELAA